MDKLRVGSGLLASKMAAVRITVNIYSSYLMSATSRGTKLISDKDA